MNELGSRRQEHKDDQGLHTDLNPKKESARGNSESELLKKGSAQDNQHKSPIMKTKKLSYQCSREMS